MPLCTKVIGSILTRSAALESCRSRANNGDAVTISVASQSYSDMSRAVGDSAEFMSTLDTFGSIDSIHKANNALIQTLRAQREMMTDSMPNSHTAKVRLIVPPAGSTPINIPALQMDPMAPSIVKTTTEEIARGLGVMTSADSNKHKTSPINTIAYILQMMSISSQIISQLLAASKLIYGIDLSKKVRESLSPENRMRQLFHLTFLGAISDNAMDGKRTTMPNTIIETELDTRPPSPSTDTDHTTKRRKGDTDA